MKSSLKKHPLLKILNSGLIDLPSPSGLSFMWNFGSILGVCLTVQLISGLFLAMHYTCDILLAFSSLSHIMRDVNLGWLLRMTHANGASFFFMFMYLHIARGIYYRSFFYMETWVAGVIILFLTMGASFLGYVLPWGQMSFWGATVITNLASAIPLMGNQIVLWLWGGFSVSNATLTRFFALHFILPFILAAVVMSHLLFLHQTGSSNILGVSSSLDKTPFSPYFIIKDLVGFSVYMFFFLGLITEAPWYLGDPENFIPANPMVTPLHIQPEWYFLFAYAVLRAIPNKLGGVIGLVLSVGVLLMLPFISKSIFKSCEFTPLKNFFFWFFINNVILLTWVGARPVEAPYIVISQILTISYFFINFINLILLYLNNY